jgi:hypothetical protein
MGFCQLLCPALSVLPQLDFHVMCNHLSHKVCEIDVKTFVLFENILSENNPSFEQHIHFVSCQIFLRVVKFR